jgi:hypothetical protein
MWRMTPGPLMSASTLVSPGAMYFVLSALPVKLGSVDVTARDRPGLSFIKPSRSWAAASDAASPTAMISTIVLLSMFVPPIFLLVCLDPRKINRILQATLDTARRVAYNPRDMDSSNDLRFTARSLSSLLWNWWAVPAAR